MLTTPQPESDRPVTLVGQESFADVIAAIAAADDLTAQEKKFWPTSLRQFAGYLGRPVESMPASIPALTPAIKKLHPEQLGVNPKTFRNHRSNVRAALLWFNRRRGGGRKLPMAEAWRDLWDKILAEDRYAKDILSPYLRYLSALDILPETLTAAELDLDAYVESRRETSFGEIKPGSRRQLVRAWNRCTDTVPGWPQVRLAVPAKGKRSDGLDYDAFPDGLRADIEAICAGLRKPRKARNGHTLWPCAESTIEKRRRELQATVRAAVTAGIPAEELQSLRDLLHPDRVAVILEDLIERRGRISKKGIIPSLYTIDLAATLYSLACELGGFTDEELARLDEMRGGLERYRRSYQSMTAKNRNVVLQVIQGGLWPKLVRLPAVLMEAARTQRIHQPYRAAVTAQLGVAIRILVRAPIRVGNLAAIQLGKNLFRRGGRNAPFHLHFDGDEVKNGEELDFELDARTTAMIDEFIQLHRPALMRGLQHDWLFPSQDARRPKLAHDLSEQIQKRLWKQLGVKITCHQFRHAAGAIMLLADPGNYEWVRRVLGHKDIRTTSRSYLFLESLSANRRFGDLMSQLDAEADDDD